MVFTDYYDPMPQGTTTCPDSNYLYTSQTEYLSGLLHQLDAMIVSTIQGLHNPGSVGASILGALRAGGAVSGA